jgi:magnesium-transporting ATPase (P-type)
MSGGAKSLHVVSLSHDFNARRFVGWTMLFLAIIVQVIVALWLSKDIRDSQNDTLGLVNFIQKNRTTFTNAQLIGAQASSCQLDLAFQSNAAPALPTNANYNNAQYKILLIVLALTLAIFGFLAISPNPFKLPPRVDYNFQLAPPSSIVPV